MVEGGGEGSLKKSPEHFPDNVDATGGRGDLSAARPGEAWENREEGERVQHEDCLSQASDQKRDAGEPFKGRPVCARLRERGWG